MAWYVYELSPIDHGWENLKTVEETVTYIRSIEENAKAVEPLGDITPTSSEFLEAWEHAQEEAREYNWEGDFRHAPKVFWLPHSDNYFAFGFVFKQDNNGTTFVVSPVDLPHLE